MSPIARAVFRHAVVAVHRVRRSVWSVSGRAPVDVRAVAVTPEGRVVLVRHRYVPGWYLPGGGRKAREAADAAILRELREEIGMTGHGRLRPIGGGMLFVVDDVRYAPPRWSLEIDAVAAFDPGDLPPQTTPRTRAGIARALVGGDDRATR